MCQKRILILPLLAVLGLVILPDMALAADATTDVMQEVKEGIATTATMAFAFLNALLYPMLVIVGALMDNEILLGPEMEENLRGIWVEIRNWVNMFFVLILVGIALYNVLGLSGEGSNYALKSILPKIVIGLVAVNFSFLAGKLAIDSVAVLTDAVYGLPTNFIDWDGERDELEKRLCSHVKESVDEEGNTLLTVTQRKTEDAPMLSSLMCRKEGDSPQAENYHFDNTNKKGELNDLGKSFFSNFGEHNVVAVMMVNMGLLADINVVDSEGGLVDELSDLTLNILFGVFMFLMFGFAYVALIVVLLARLLILWICLALSPFIVLFFIFPDIASNIGGELNIKEKFLQHLFVPLIIGIVFSIGFTMLSVLKGSSSGSWMGAIQEVKFSDLEDATQLQATLNTAQITDFQSLLIAVAAVVIIWVGVFGAADKTIANSITNTIKGAGEKAGKFMASLPLYATAIPIPGRVDEKTGEQLKMNPLSLFTAISDIPRRFRSESQRKADTFLTGGSVQGKADIAKTNFRESDPSGNIKEIDTFLRYKGSPDSDRDLAALLRGLPGDHETDPKLREIDDALSAIGDRGIAAQLEKEDSALRRAIDQYAGETGILNPDEWGETNLKKALSTADASAAGAAATGAATTGDGETDDGDGSTADGTPADGSTPDGATGPTGSFAAYAGQSLTGDDKKETRTKVRGRITSDDNLASIFNGDISGAEEAIEAFKALSETTDGEEMCNTALENVNVDADGNLDLDSFISAMDPYMTTGTGEAASDMEPPTE